LTPESDGLLFLAKGDLRGAAFRVTGFLEVRGFFPASFFDAALLLFNDLGLALFLATNF
jgi:hypothetical protein